ncbi:DUF4224 domain-containing protein [Alcaligenaceae bacterium 429]|uniref:DUF4224 domain-containing protein n=1 Tax=Paenalcaligenes TaxID=1100891 RepID=UPI0010925EC3|nr:DUF4224 domain-containing protein [Paenalcaligenes suwonensis]NHC63055.1 DUF4224 domain-containing protein [Paenalcaligenes suwonensis]TGV06373.1 DUF4224 domain-containing protein [Alcaligenaceae bacterium 429]
MSTRVRKNSLTLNDPELTEITGKTRNKGRIEVLTQMGIPFRIRPDGSLVVLKAVIEVELGYAPKETQSAPPRLRIPKARGLLLCQKQ